VVGMIACLKPQKSPQDFIKLANIVSQIMPDIKFLLVGDGILRANIERLIGKLNLKNNIILAGWRQDIPRILAVIDIFILTSLWEGLPIVVLEAMASSRPIVVTQTGGIQEIIIDGKTGFLVPTRDIGRMAERLITLLKDAELRSKIGQNARNSLNFDFCIENMASKTQYCYDNLILDKGVGYVS